jgi:2-polyprenyl-6-methoxyphenol hydroxylase-like FAD-dependent oxidoreductase
MTARVATTSEQDPAAKVLDIHETTCCIVGSGPGGMMLALLLARQGVAVTLLEAHPTFERDFRGDTIHPGLLEILDEVGVADRLHDRQHVKMYGPTLPTADGPVMLFDLRQLLKTRFPYIMWMPQPIFLAFLAEEARKYSSFRLVMGANVQRLVEQDGVVRGVRYRTTDGWHEVRAILTVGADGRFSRVRKLAGIHAIQTSAPVELLWLRLPRLPDDPPATGIATPRFGKGQALLLIDRADHWQVGYFFPAGDYAKLQAAGVEAMRRNIALLEPRFAENAKALKDWHQFSLLSVASGRCRRWYQPGLLLIGDAAHTMTPFAGAGIKYAIEDAVVAANLLTAPLKAGRVRMRDLAHVQRQREWPTRIIQAFGTLFLWRFSSALRSGNIQTMPRLVRLLFGLPFVAKVVAQLVAFGFWRVHVQDSRPAEDGE